MSLTIEATRQAVAAEEEAGATSKSTLPPFKADYNPHIPHEKRIGDITKSRAHQLNMPNAVSSLDSYEPSTMYHNETIGIGTGAARETERSRWLSVARNGAIHIKAPWDFWRLPARAFSWGSNVLSSLSPSISSNLPESLTRPTEEEVPETDINIVSHQPRRENSQFRASVQSNDVFKSPPMSNLSHMGGDKAGVLVLPISSSKVNRYRSDRDRYHSSDLNIYIGNPRYIFAPESVEREWINIVRRELLADLRKVIASLPPSIPKHETMIEPDLRMAGEATQESTTVTLRPTVWISCGGKKCKRAVSQAVKDLKYVHSFSQGPVQVHLRAPMLAAFSKSHGIPRNPSINSPTFPGLSDLQVESYPPAGSPDHLRIGSEVHFRGGNKGRVEHRISTLGGFIVVDGIEYGLTAAHAAVELATGYSSNDSSSSGSGLELEPWSARRRKRAPHMGGSGEVYHESSSDVEEASHRSSSEDEGEDERISSGNLTLGCVDCEESKDFAEKYGRPFGINQKVKLLGYAGNVAGPGINTLGVMTLSEGSDFALLEPTSTHELDPHHINTYAVTQQEVIPVDAISMSGEEGPVLILCSDTDVRTGYLLRGDSTFMEGVSIFHTRRLQTEGPLESGLSGAWVVRGSDLLGFIIAVYPNEPYAHMIPMSKVVQDIKIALFDGRRLPKIELPQIKVPDSVLHASTISPNSRRQLGATQLNNYAYDQKLLKVLKHVYELKDHLIELEKSERAVLKQLEQLGQPGQWRSIDEVTGMDYPKNSKLQALRSRDSRKVNVYMVFVHYFVGHMILTCLHLYLYVHVGDTYISNPTEPPTLRGSIFIAMLALISVMVASLWVSASIGIECRKLEHGCEMIFWFGVPRGRLHNAHLRLTETETSLKFTDESFPDYHTT